MKHGPDPAPSALVAVMVRIWQLDGTWRQPMWFLTEVHERSTVCAPARNWRKQLRFLGDLAFPVLRVLLLLRLLWSATLQRYRALEAGIDTGDLIFPRWFHRRVRVLPQMQVCKTKVCFATSRYETTVAVETNATFSVALVVQRSHASHVLLLLPKPDSTQPPLVGYG